MKPVMPVKLVMLPRLDMKKQPQMGGMAARSLNEMIVDVTAAESTAIGVGGVGGGDTEVK